MNTTNLITAIHDPNLWGDCLITPLKTSVQAFQYTFSTWPKDLQASQKLCELFKRTMLLAASAGTIFTLPLALVGTAVKWIHLGLRIDELVHKGSAISYYLPPELKMFSRLGDRTVAYLNTKYVAEKYQLPLYFVPFKGCENFAFSEEEKFTGSRYFKKVVHLTSADDIQNLQSANKTTSTLYLLPFFPHTRDVEAESDSCSYIKYTTEWASFKPRVKELLKVIKPYNELAIPEGSYSIALHIRDGGCYDDAKTKTMHPLKLPSMNFYLGELEKSLNIRLHPPQSTYFYSHLHGRG